MNAYNFVIFIVIPTIFVQNVSKMYINTSKKNNHRIPPTRSRVITKVHDLLGQPSYNAILHKTPDSQTYLNRILNEALYFILGFKSFYFSI